MNNWEEKDINIQVAQAVNLAVSIYSKDKEVAMDKVKKSAREFYAVLSELKQEIMAKEVAHEAKVKEEAEGMVDEDIENDFVGNG